MNVKSKITHPQSNHVSVISKLIRQNLMTANKITPQKLYCSFEYNADERFLTRHVIKDSVKSTRISVLVLL